MANAVRYAWPGDAATDRPNLTAATDSRAVAIDGWMCPFQPGASFSYFALLDEPPCCFGCLPREPDRRIEVFTEDPLPFIGARLRLTGALHVLTGDPAGWRFQLRGARVVAAPGLAPRVLSRRHVLAAAPLACLAVAAPGARAADGVTNAQARAAVADMPTVDIHTHTGGVSGVRRVSTHAPFSPVAAPMRGGGMAVICLAAVSDSPTHHLTADHRIRPYRDPEPGELYAYGQAGFQRVHELAAAEGLAIITDAASLARARSDHPSLIVTAEGADFLEGQVDRVNEAYDRWTLRHLQLTHYRVNELGDIQTEPPVHGGLTPVGAEVVRRCNRLGIVVDVAHGTYDLVKQAAAVTTKPLVLSHTSLTDFPGPHTRLISPDHARVIAGTGGVIGIWPPARTYPDMPAMAGGIARMVDVVGIDHVGLGSDMEGLVGPAIFANYGDLPGLSAALLDRGFQVADVRKLLGVNYVRVFTASLA